MNKSLSKAQLNTEYIIEKIDSDNEELTKFLFTLGCYAGECVTAISIISKNIVISVKDARYSIDLDLADCIIVK